jgi:lysophospholipid acyltransferase (LPLAT)-like uncharacterized protein
MREKTGQKKFETTGQKSWVSGNSKNHALKKIVEEVKKGSSKWMKTDGPKNKNFYWQHGYAAFSVSGLF